MFDSAGSQAMPEPVYQNHNASRAFGVSMLYYAWRCVPRGKLSYRYLSSISPSPCRLSRGSLALS